MHMYTYDHAPHEFDLTEPLIVELADSDMLVARILTQT